MNQDITGFNKKQNGERQEICKQLAKEIDSQFSKAENKIWHGSPVWFLEGNPIVGYAALKNCIQLLFWSGQSFDEPDLKPEGSFKAAEKRYTSIEEINSSDMQRWLKKAKDIQWDYKNIVKRRGVLERLK